MTLFIDIHREYDAVLRVVQEHFKHLSLEHIKTPPHIYFDAALARQIAIHLMEYELGWARRHMAEELGRGREAIWRGQNTVARRIEESEAFAIQYRVMAMKVRAPDFGKEPMGALINERFEEELKHG